MSSVVQTIYKCEENHQTTDEYDVVHIIWVVVGVEKQHDDKDGDGKKKDEQ
jgi:hypothetical protein